LSVIAILQARMTSTRLPGKVLMDIEGMPMIGRQIERVRQANLIDELVIATSTDASDDMLAQYVESIGVNVQRGPLQDVLQRFVQVLDVFNFKDVVRLTADCPLADPDVIDGVISLYQNSDFDYVSNSLQRTFPRGLDVEVFKNEVLRTVSQNDDREISREHVTYGIYSRADIYTTSNFAQNPSFSNFRWTVDTQEDLDFIRNVYRHFAPMNMSFRQHDILDWIDRFPQFAHFESTGAS
jgi:spore coat polysaccharide biosynthesis protein SpsF